MKKLALCLAVLALSLAGCGGKNIHGNQPKYPIHFLARDISVGAYAFLKESEKNHGHECRAHCTLDTIKDKNLCVTICNSIKLAGELHKTLNAAIDTVCNGPGWREDTAPCTLSVDPALKAQQEAALNRALSDYRKAESDLKAARAKGGSQ